MAILDNLEAYVDIEPNQGKCYYCTNKAKYDDVTKTPDSGYRIIGVCQCHFVQDVS
jgi:hypothetical protein